MRRKENIQTVAPSVEAHALKKWTTTCDISSPETDIFSASRSSLLFLGTRLTSGGGPSIPVTTPFTSDVILMQVQRDRQVQKDTVSV